MSKVLFSHAFYFTLTDNDTVWPCTVAGVFRLSVGGNGHNIRNAGEYDATESEMIDGVLNTGLASRFRSKSHPSRSRNSNHFSVDSPSVRSVHVNVGGVFVRLR